MNIKDLNEEIEKHLKEDVMTVQELYSDVKMLINTLQKGLQMLQQEDDNFEEPIKYLSSASNDLVYAINRFKSDMKKGLQ